MLVLMVVALSLVVVYLTNRPAVDQHLSASSLVRRVRLAIRVMLSSGRATSEVRLTLTLTLPSLNPNSLTYSLTLTPTLTLTSSSLRMNR